MTDVRISREALDALIQSGGELRISRGSLESLIQTSGEIRVSRLVVESLITQAPPGELPTTGAGWGIPIGI